MFLDKKKGDNSIFNANQQMYVFHALIPCLQFFKIREEKGNSNLVNRISNYYARNKKNAEALFKILKIMISYNYKISSLFIVRK